MALGKAGLLEEEGKWDIFLLSCFDLAGVSLPSSW